MWRRLCQRLHKRMTESVGESAMDLESALFRFETAIMSRGTLSDIKPDGTDARVKALVNC